MDFISRYFLSRRKIFRSVYSYETGYYFVMAWCLLLSLYFIVMLLFKCRAPGKRWLQKLPLFVLLANVFLSVLYCLKIIRMDLVAVDCMFIVVLLEACIQSGLIRSNSGYGMLFASALMEAQILDKNGMVCYASRQVEKMDENARSRMEDPENKGIILENRRLNWCGYCQRQDFLVGKCRGSAQVYAQAGRNQ